MTAAKVPGCEACNTMPQLGECPVHGPKLLCSTGHATLDSAIGIGGYPAGVVVELFGTDGDQLAKLYADALASAQRAGHTTALVDMEHRGGLALPDDSAVAQPNSGEEALRTIETLLRSGVRFVVVDSVAALVPQDIIDGGARDSHDVAALCARLMSQALRKLTTQCFKHGATVLFVNAFTRQPARVTPEHLHSGSNALKFYASVRIEIRRREHDLVAKVVKNKCAAPFKTATLETTFDHAAAMRRGELHSNLLDLIEQHGLADVRWMLDVIQRDDLAGVAEGGAK